MKLLLAALIQSDIDRINARAAWTDEQKEVFEKLLRERGKKIDTALMHELAMDNRQYYRIKKEVRKKIERILQE